jgi:hypothetical protein
MRLQQGLLKTGNHMRALVKKELINCFSSWPTGQAQETSQDHVEKRK